MAQNNNDTKRPRKIKRRRGSRTNPTDVLNQDQNSVSSGLEDMVKTGVKKLGFMPRVGVLPLLSENQYSSKSAAIIEYIKNEWDADASEVNVTIGYDSITIDGNGKGMNLDTLENFFYIGESGQPVSKEERKTAGGRQIMGKYGIGNIAAFALGEGYRLITTQEGSEQEICYDSNLDEMIKAEKEGKDFEDFMKEPELRKTDKNKHGTKIEIYGLKPRVKKQIKSIINQLKVEVGKRMPVRGNGFKVMINEDKVEHYMDVFLKDANKTEMSFTVQDEDGNEYKVNGFFYESQKALKPSDSGIYPVVNAEVLTGINGHMYGPDNIRAFSALKNRIYGEFQADFLDDKLNGARDHYNDVDGMLVTSIYKEIKKYMNKLVKDIEDRKKENHGQVLEDVLENASADISYVMEKLGYSVFNPNTGNVTGGGAEAGKHKKKRKFKPRRKPEEIPPEEKQYGTHPKGPLAGREDRLGQQYIDLAGHRFNFRYSPLGENELNIWLNSEGNEILVNTDHPMFRNIESNEETLTNYVTCGLLRTIIDYKVIEIDGNGVGDAQSLYSKALSEITKVK